MPVGLNCRTRSGNRECHTITTTRIMIMPGINIRTTVMQVITVGITIIMAVLLISAGLS